MCTAVNITAATESNRPLGNLYTYYKQSFPRDQCGTEPNCCLATIEIAYCELSCENYLGVSYTCCLPD